MLQKKDKRDRISEIEEIKSRVRYFHRTFHLFRVDDLKRDYEALNVESEVREEMKRYFPLSLVANLEVYVRNCVQVIIDHEEFILEKIETLTSAPKLDYKLLSAIHGKKVTVGELLSHTVSVNNKEDINSLFSTIMSIDFFDKLKKVSDRWEVEVKGHPSDPIISDNVEFFNIFTEIFRTRHILAHEVPSDFVLTDEQIEKYFKFSSLFIKATDEVVEELINPNAPLTQRDMTDHAYNRYSEADKKLNNELEKIKSYFLLNPDVKLEKEFEKSQDLWKCFREADSESFANQYRGGSIAPQMYALHATDITKERIKHLEIWFRSMNNEP